MADRLAKPAVKLGLPPGWQSVLARLAAACAVYALVIGTVFGDMLYRTDAVFSLVGTDTWRQFYPWRQFGFGELAHGHLALWNPYLFSGAPYLGGFQAALLYPPNWIYLLLSLPMAINLGIALHIFLAGVFMYCWAAHRRLHWAACVSAGLVYMFSGPVFGRIMPGHIAHIDTVAWAPLIFLAIDDLTTTRSLRGALLGSAAFAMQIFAGHPQYAFYTGVAATIYFALNLRAAPSRRRATGGFLLIFVGGSLLAAVQLFTGLGATAEAMRSHTSFAFASTFSFPPESLLTMIMPGFFGDYTNAHPYWGKSFWWEATAYVSVVGFVLACFALLAPRRNRRFAFTLAAISLVIGLGGFTPVFRIIYYVPGFNSFRGIAKFMFLFTMFGAMLSGIGLDRLLAGEGKRKWPVAVVGIVSAVALLGAWFVYLQSMGKWTSLWGRMLLAIDWSHNHSLVSAIDLDLLSKTALATARQLCWTAIIGLVLTGLLIAGRFDRRALLAIPALLAVEAGVYARDYLPTFSTARYRYQIAEVNRCLVPLPPDARVWSTDEGQLMMADRLNSWGDDPMMLRRYIEFMADALGTDTNTLMTGEPPKPLPGARLLRLVRMAGVLTIDRSGAHFKKLDAPILPRAGLVSQVDVEPDRTRLLARMNDPHFDPTRTALVESPIAPTPAGATDPGSVSVHDIDSDTLDIEATAKSPCLLVVTDSYSRGWHAEALPDSDQHAYEVIPADLTLRGVPLSAGHHHFRMIYRPMAYVVGKWTSIAAIALYLLAAAGWLRRDGAKLSLRPY